VHSLTNRRVLYLKIKKKLIRLLLVWLLDQVNHCISLIRYLGQFLNWYNNSDFCPGIKWICVFNSYLLGPSQQSTETQLAGILLLAVRCFLCQILLFSVVPFSFQHSVLKFTSPFSFKKYIFNKESFLFKSCAF